ncbi:MAG: hypothetical protein CM15mP4_1500 [Candidatus Neomarinimicrobiota bacterium]|nr:MAG: hypothetical protein CM15mP4_1500 [Candidatus Neomarinimicrobiota bacterium]
MPPKSTWFEPKLLDGLLSHLIIKIYSRLKDRATRETNLNSGLHTLKRILSSPSF